ncbi:hypothetical protein B005_5031 [Nocardiopsis alba ATCC BAA-2165]|uniref:Uncharacterized protein n=1 Tax=Nocardiopsis alba (strain ATCC BAA-2165 / BE74) TaxID=1205910 RepID=J7L4P3_NOCAA|nr:hypothetical protein B005_5031 [Nocardiopsis alba ATCC BAA-2165]
MKGRVHGRHGDGRRRCPFSRDMGDIGRHDHSGREKGIGSKTLHP